MSTTPRYDANPTIDHRDPDAYAKYAASLDESNPDWEWDEHARAGMAHGLAFEAQKRRTSAREKYEGGNTPKLATGGPVSRGTTVLLPPLRPTTTEQALQRLTGRVDALEDRLDESLMENEYEPELVAEPSRTWADVVHTAIIAAAIVAVIALFVWGAK